jgi:hypothetical protein
MNNRKSSRIRRRNYSGYKGEGNHKAYFKNSKPFGDYTDPLQNGKSKDIREANRRRSILGFSKSSFKFDDEGNIIPEMKGTRNRQFCKKYADQHQR